MSRMILAAVVAVAAMVGQASGEETSALAATWGPLPEACKATGEPNEGWSVSCVSGKHYGRQIGPLLEHARDEWYLGNQAAGCRSMKLAVRKRSQAVEEYAKCYAYRKTVTSTSGIHKTLQEMAELDCRAHHASGIDDKAEMEEQC